MLFYNNIKKSTHVVFFRFSHPSVGDKQDPRWRQAERQIKFTINMPTEAVETAYS